MSNKLNDTHDPVGVQNLEPLPEQKEDRCCSDDYVHACHQLPFSKSEDTKPFFSWLLVVLGVPVVIMGFIIYALFKWVFNLLAL